jgi:hypothetical protein
MATNDPPPCIWDSLDALQGHPLLLTALENVKAKIGNCVSRSYNIYDNKPDTNDHMQVLLNLPGVFTVGDMNSEDHVVDYAFTDYRGVTINEILVNASTAYHEGGEHDELTTASYVALFEEAIEHELAHMKTHHEKLDDPGIELLTPPSPPLHGESGYAVNLKTRGRSLTMAASLLEVSDDCFRREFAPPLSLYLCPIDLANSIVRRGDGGNPLTLKELQSHMVYPTGCPEKGAESVSKRTKTDTHRFDKPSDRDETESPKRKIREGREGSSQPIQSCTDEAGHDREDARLEKPSTMTQEEFMKHKQSAAFKCQVSNVAFCDKDRNPKTAFKPSEDICVLLTFKNPAAATDAVIRCPRGKFGRGGICMKLADTPHNYVRTAPHNTPFVRIPPGEEYTFFRRMSSPKGSSKSLMLIYTPEEAGEYAAKVMNYPAFEFEGSHTFKIEEA